MNTDKQKTTAKVPKANRRDFIFISKGQPMRVRKLGEKWMLMDLHHDPIYKDEHWHQIDLIGAELAMEFYLRAISDQISLQLEKGLPFLPKAQIEIFWELEGHMDGCLITPQTGKLDVGAETTGCGKMPARWMFVGFLDRKTETYVANNRFSCS